MLLGFKDDLVRIAENKFIIAGVAAVGLCLYFFLASSGDDKNDMIAGEALADVKVPTLSAAATAGESAFKEYCALCHGANAEGQDGVAPPLVHKIYEPSHHGDASIVLAVKQGVRAHHWPFGNMDAVEGISDADIASIIVYVRELQRANGIK